VRALVAASAAGLTHARLSHRGVPQLEARPAKDAPQLNGPQPLHDAGRRSGRHQRPRAKGETFLTHDDAAATAIFNAKNRSLGYGPGWQERGTCSNQLTVFEFLITRDLPAVLLPCCPWWHRISGRPQLNRAAS